MNNGAMLTLFVGVGLVVLLGLYLWLTYRSLVALRSRVDEAWNSIIVQLKRRADLIPNIVEAVKEHAAHEQEVFRSVTAARAETISARTPLDAAAADAQLQAALKGMFAVAEAYPQLQANQHFLQLQSELADTENKLQAARRFYNGGVREHNTKLQIFPNSLVASMFGFRGREFFEVENVSTIAEPPRIQF